MHISFRCIREEKPGGKWKSLFDHTWPHYRQWFLSEGHASRKGYLSCYSELRNHMPELLPVYEELMQLSGGGDLEARFLSMYCPPAYMSGCSQVAWTRENTSLIRNYDYSSRMFEGVMLYSNWISPVIGVSDCTWGLLDGMNASGLAASLAFGGRNVMGEGFGVPLVIRYVLETSTTVTEALTVLKRIPIHMAYNVTLIDISNAYATVFLSPDRAPVVVDSVVATNHQLEVEWNDYAVLARTIERKRLLDDLVTSSHETEDSMIRHFLVPPLYSRSKSFGTLYSIIYRVKTGEAELFWPGVNSKQAFSNFIEDRIVPF